MGQIHVTPRLAAAVTVVGGVLVVGGQPVSAEAFVVTTLDDVVDPNDGELSLREAVNAANDLVDGPDSISFAPGLAGEIVLSDELPVIGELSIVGPGAEVLTLQGGGGRVLYIYGNADFSLSGVTLATNGSAIVTSGGADVVLDSVSIGGTETAVLITGGTLSVARSEFDGNLEAVRAVELSELSVVDSSFTNNGTESIAVLGSADGEMSVSIVDSTLTNNEEAIVVEDVSGTVSISGSSIKENSDAGIVINFDSDVSVVMDDVVMSDNEDVARIYATRGFSATDLTLSGNEDGMRVHAESDVVAVSMSTFADNGMYALQIEKAGEVEISDSMFTGNVGRGLSVEDAGDLSVTRSSFVDNGLYGLAAYADDVVLTEVTATGNSEGVEIRGSNTVTIAGADVSNNDGHGMEVDAEGEVEISESVFSSNGDDGLTADSDGSITVRSVVASFNGYLGAIVDGGNVDQSVVVEGLTAIDNGEVGLYVRGPNGGLVTVSDATIAGGQRGVGAGYNGSDLELSMVSVSDTESIGLYLPGTSVSLQDVEVDGAGGLGVRARAFDLGEIDLDGVTLVNNGEGAMYASGGTVSMVNSTITGNGFDTNGATLSFADSDVSIVHSTIADNALGAPNAEAFCPYACPGVIFRKIGTVSVEHSIVTGNADEDDVQGLVTIPRQAPPPATIEHSVVPARVGGSDSNVAVDDPLLAPLADNGGVTRTMLPLPGSPALDSGDPAFAGPPGVDQRGLPRPAGVVDIGAVEVQGGVITAADVSVFEDLEAVDVVLTRSGAPDAAVSVDVVLVDGTAVSPADFGAPSPVSVSWLAGEVGDKVVSIPIVDDGVAEGAESFQVAVSTVSPIEDVSQASSTVTIRDNGDVVSSLNPARFVDTRDAGDTFDDLFEAEGKREADSEYRVDIAGRGGVPVDAKAVVMNVTAVAAEGVGFVTAHPCLGERPLASSLNHTPGVNLANEIVAPLSADGEVCLYTSQGAHLLVDVVGYVGADSPLVPVDPARYLDTRAAGTTFDGNDQQVGRTSAAGEVALPVAGRGSVPADAAAVVVNVTAVGPTETGFVTVHPCVGEPPNASSLNYVAGVNRANELIASVNDDGEICLFTSSSINVLVDVVGYIPAGTALTPVAPSRFLDTRVAGETIDGLSEAEGKQSADSEYELQVAGRAGLPDGVSAVVMNVTAVGAEGTGFVTVHPCAPIRPNASSLNYVAGINSANELIAQLDADGRLCVYSSESTHLLVDVVAYID